MGTATRTPRPKPRPPREGLRALSERDRIAGASQTPGQNPGNRDLRSRTRTDGRGWGTIGAAARCTSLTL